MEETVNNHNPIILLIVVLVVFLLLLGLWWSGFSFWKAPATTTTRPTLTEAERAALVEQNKNFMMQFATATPMTPSQMDKERQVNLEFMEKFQKPSSDADNLIQTKKNLEFMKLFQ